MLLVLLPKNGWWNNGIVAYHDNDMMSNGAIPNQELLKKEHENLIETLDKYSLETIIIPFKPELEESKKYDFVFMRDHFLCNANKDIVMCNMKLSERMNEGEYVISTLNDLQYKVSFLDDNCIAEGGEFFYLPKKIFYWQVNAEIILGEQNKWQKNLMYLIFTL